jgi:hypothetical protein
MEEIQTTAEHLCVMLAFDIKPLVRIHFSKPLFEYFDDILFHSDPANMLSRRGRSNRCRSRALFTFPRQVPGQVLMDCSGRHVRFPPVSAAPYAGRDLRNKVALSGHRCLDVAASRL